ncbi:MAG: YicC family protein [Betaproteobacteria bacterium HGW-Betaproteobacteria-8]|nr:MAG: YicC family protein [Betaproteobacteria bacterium HGW-Betaproteobacteria-8]
MIYSMTGFAALEKETAYGVLVLELRAVNHRYLELQLKLDESMRSFEPMLREMIASKLGRGKVECRLSLMQRSAQAKEAKLDNEVLQQLVQMSAIVQTHFPQSQPLTVADVLRWPNVMLGEQVDQAALAEAVREALAAALQQMTDSRQREGEKLKAYIEERLGEIEQRVAEVKPLLPAQVKLYQDKLTAKLQEAMKSFDEERLRQEVTLFAQRIDVDEELGRLTAHVSEVRRILKAGGAAGKRLDFLMQELNREANTLGSKSFSTEISQVAMALKVLIEQMREQIQNIE